MTRSRGKKVTAFEALQKRLRERLPTDNAWITILGYEGEPRKGHAFNDRAIAIVLPAILEQYLETAVSTHFAISDEEARPLFDDNIDGPLSSFARKIAIGYALGIYGKSMRSNLTCIRHIRNAFAHSKMHLEFATPDIATIFEHLILPASHNFEELIGGKPSTLRHTFASTVRLIASYLNHDQKPMKFEGSNFYQMLYEESP
jgi:DNA-binding MltR family transcriptional regulator